LAVIMGRSDSYTETQAMIPVAAKPLPVLLVVTNDARLPSSPTMETRAILSVNDKATGKAIVFRDSFAGSWYHFLGQQFNEVFYIWHYDWDTAFLEREKPDVVIDEMLERYFNNADPKELLKKDDLR
jgi:hypothetical protein